MQRVFTRGLLVKLGVLAATVAATSGAAITMVPASAQQQSEQTCVGTSTSSGGTWSFDAGTAAFPPSATTTACSLATTTDDGVPPAVGTLSLPDLTSAPLLNGDTNPVDTVSWAVGALVVSYCAAYANALPLCDGGLQEESLAASTLAISGTGTFSCANGGNGTLASPSLADEEAGGGNVINTGTGYTGVDNTANIVWSAAFSNGVGQVTGTLYGSPGSTPEPVTGVIAVNCRAASGSAPNTLSLLTFPSMPVTG